MAVKTAPGKTRKSRNELSNAAHKKRRLEESTVSIPTLTPSEKRRRRKLEADPEAWIWEMCGPKSGLLEPLTRLFTSQQAEMIGTYRESLKFGGDDLVLASRGEGKTTYLRAMVWKSTATGEIDFAAFVSATGDDAANSREAIKDMTVKSRPFAKLYPEIAIPCIRANVSPQSAKTMRATGSQHNDGRKQFKNHLIKFQWSDELWLPDVPGSPSARAMILFRGADKAIRGLNKFGRRPRIIAIDDLDTPDLVSNPDLVRKVVDRVNNDIGGLKGQTGQFSRIMLATLPKQGCGVAHHYATTGHPFVVHRFRYLIEKPVAWAMWMQYVKRRQRAKIDGDKYARDAFNFYRLNREEMDFGHKVSNEYRFVSELTPDGSPQQLSALQAYFDDWADNGEMYCRCELDNEIIATEQRIESRLEMGHVTRCEGNHSRLIVESSTDVIVGGIDVRRAELHYSVMSSDADLRHRVIDYNVQTHGSGETTVQQSESLIAKALHRLADSWKQEPYRDHGGAAHRIGLTLVDKGWKGNWNNEDGERKSWATQPVETFCMERGLRHWLPAKGQPNYKSPADSPECIVGDHWHMNRGAGAERSCTEVIWDAEYWHSLVADLFMLSAEDSHRFSLFVAPSDPDQVWVNHAQLTKHIYEGAEELGELRRTAGRARKPKYRRDHWWDSFAMMLVARSIEDWFRQHLPTKTTPSPSRAYRQTPIPSHEEIGAR